MNTNQCRSIRILYLYCRLQEGQTLVPSCIEDEFNITKRTFMRDIDELKAFLANKGSMDGDYQLLEYNKRVGGYILSKIA